MIQYRQNKLFLLHDIRSDIEIFKQIVSIKKRSEIFLKRDNITIHTILCLNSHEGKNPNFPNFIFIQTMKVYFSQDSSRFLYRFRYPLQGS